MEFQQQRPRTGRPATATAAVHSGGSSINPALTASPDSTLLDTGRHSLTETSPHGIETKISHLARRPYTSSGNGHKAPTYSQPLDPPPLVPPSCSFATDEISAPQNAILPRLSDGALYSSQVVVDCPQLPYSTDNLNEPITERGVLTNARPAAGEGPSGYTRPEHFARSELWSSGKSNPIETACSSSDPGEPRPTTAKTVTSATSAEPALTEYTFPPRRELPFKRPNSQRSDGRSSSPRPGTAIIPLTPLPTKQAIEHNSNSRGGLRNLVARPGTPLRYPSSSPQKRDRDETKEELLGTSTDDRSQHPQDVQHCAKRVDTRLFSPPRSNRMDEILEKHKRDEISSRSYLNNLNRAHSVVDAPPDLASPPATARPHSRIKTAAVPEELVNRAYSAIQSSMADRTELALGQYVSHSMEDRQAALDSFMLAKLNDPNFAILCSDIENCWRRITLGL